jgi:hypothetical protein
MRAVEFAQTQIVEAVVIVAGKPHGAILVFPDPGAEAILELLLFFPRGDCLLLERSSSGKPSPSQSQSHPAISE